MALRRRGRGTRVLGATGALLAAGVLAAACSTTSSGTAAGAAGSSGSGTASATASGSTVSTRSTSLGTVLETSTGMTLYHLTTEHGGQIQCTGSCASTWPPYTVAAGTTPTAGPGVSGLATTTRPDGSTQVTYNGEALYHFSGDSAPGDTNGNGISGVWFAVKAAGGTGSTGSSGSTSSSSSSSGGYGGGY